MKRVALLNFVKSELITEHWKILVWVLRDKKNFLTSKRWVLLHIEEFVKESESDI